MAPLSPIIATRNAGPARSTASGSQTRQHRFGVNAIEPPFGMPAVEDLAPQADTPCCYSVQSATGKPEEANWKCIPGKALEQNKRCTGERRGKLFRKQVQPKMLSGSSAGLEFRAATRNADWQCQSQHRQRRCQPRCRTGQTRWGPPGPTSNGCHRYRG